jgi:hypothetical protein
MYAPDDVDVADGRSGSPHEWSASGLTVTDWHSRRGISPK